MKKKYFKQFEALFSCGRIDMVFGMKYYTIYLSSMGNVLLISDGKYLIHLGWEEKNLEDEIKKDDLPVFLKTKKWLEAYFNSKNLKMDIPLKMEGTTFQKEVWNLLLKIPYGHVATYGDLAEQIARKRNIPKMSSQAVGNAVHHNPIPIIVPCHRVIGKNKNLVGYGLGMDLKIKLLKLEGMNLQGYYFYEDKNKKFVE